MAVSGWSIRVAVCVLVLGACGYPPLGQRTFDDAGIGRFDDAGMGRFDDAFLIPPDAPTFCYGSTTSLVKVCLAGAPTEELTVENAAMTINTDTSALCATNVLSGGDSYCVVARTNIKIDGILRGTGSKPLVLIASESITGTTNDGSIDVSSNRSFMTERGAGSDPATCNAAATAPKMKGGGAGGSFLFKGGDGGDGQNTANTGGTAGNPIAANTITTLRGGCPGQDGDNNAGSAGHGGGAVALIAGTKIALPGSVFANGEGGLGAAVNKGGGGGAGAGGMIGVDAPTIEVDDAVYANGAGGGGGISGVNTAGTTGADASGAGPASGGPGGGGSGGSGGNGSSATSAGGGIPGSSSNGGNGNAGGGGGGGGAGFIKAPATANFGTKVYPPRTP